MQRIASLPLILAIATLFLTGAHGERLAAQGLSFTPFAASDAGAAGSPPLVGLAATAWSGPVGWRLSAAMDLSSSPVAPLVRHGQSTTDAWQGDLDLILDLGRMGLRPAGVDPRIFTGLGIDGGRSRDLGAATVPVWSYGAGAGMRLASWVSLEFEARYRMLHESRDEPLPPGVGAGLESRAGLAVHLGSPGRAAARGRTVPATHPQGRSGGAVRIGGSGASAAGVALNADAAAVARSTLETAELYVGTRYVWGGSSPREGFDCSGFVRYVYAEQGITLPRVSRDQARAGVSIPARVEALAPGDLMFYADRNGVVNHVAIYAGNGRIIHSSSTGRGVRYDDLNSSRGRYYATRMVAARRVIPDGGGAMRFSESR